VDYQKNLDSRNKVTYLIHILAKHATPMKAKRTVLGRVPAKLRTFVIKIRSIAVLLSADAIVKPPISNMIVGENITENINLKGSLACINPGQSFNSLCSVHS
jgi:hypothetical protein